MGKTGAALKVLSYLVIGMAILMWLNNQDSTALFLALLAIFAQREA